MHVHQLHSCTSHYSTQFFYNICHVQTTQRGEPHSRRLIYAQVFLNKVRGAELLSF